MGKTKSKEVDDSFNCFKNLSIREQSSQNSLKGDVNVIIHNNNTLQNKNINDRNKT